MKRLVLIATTRATACGRVAPSVIAASSSSSGIDWKHARSSHMETGSEKAG